MIRREFALLLERGQVAGTGTRAARAPPRRLALQRTSLAGTGCGARSGQAGNRATWGTKGQRSGERLPGSREIWGAAVVVPRTAETSALEASRGEAADGVASPCTPCPRPSQGQARRDPGSLGLGRGVSLDCWGARSSQCLDPYRGLVCLRAFVTRGVHLTPGPLSAASQAGPWALESSIAPTLVGVIATPCPAPQPSAPHPVAPTTQGPGRCRIPQGQGPRGRARRRTLDWATAPQSPESAGDVYLPEDPGQPGLRG